MSARSLEPTPSARREWHHLGPSVAPWLARLDERARAGARRLVVDDMTTEYDARFLSSHLRGLGLELSEAFLGVEESWAEDEERHFRGFRSVVQAGWDDDCSWLAERAADFAPLAHLFEDEFSILCLFAYDELATVRGYTRNLPAYDRLGPEFGSYVRAVIADEAWHYARFFDVCVNVHAHRLEDAPAAIARVRAAEGRGDAGGGRLRGGRRGGRRNARYPADRGLERRQPAGCRRPSDGGDRPAPPAGLPARPRACRNRGTG